MPFCSSCGTPIESGEKCARCSGVQQQSQPDQQNQQYQQYQQYQQQYQPAYGTAPAAGAPSNMGIWINEMFSTFLKLLTGSYEQEWVFKNSQAAIWAAACLAAVLQATAAALAASDALGYMGQIYGGLLGGMGLSTVKTFFFGFFANVVSTFVIFGVLYLVLAVGRSNASPWNLLGVSAYGNLFMGLVMFLAYIFFKIHWVLGMLIILMGYVAYVQILSQGFRTVSDIGKSATFFGVPISIAVNLGMFYLYTQIWMG